ncbi:3-hydroxyacyl-CoA dehydrogenase family protein [Nonomuraea sp. NPDC050540]|uniref:3-hydroxyacyl-CoA dehydrogenase family protein n=1 Tax=Nonomuraea sp. NPDC050540 TaxID=3364367 RepID=UPI0037967D2B
MTDAPHRLRVAVIGGGRMGAGIAQVFLTAGAEVTVQEPEAAAAHARIAKGLAIAESRSTPTGQPPSPEPATPGSAHPRPVTPGSVGPGSVTSGSVSPGSVSPGVLGSGGGVVRAVEALARLVMGPVPRGVDLVVEAVPEDPKLKVEVLAEAEARAGERAVLASNTSSLSIGELAAGLDRPERLIGLHFFNPVPVQKLVEIVVTPGTPDDVLGRAQGWVELIGKTGVVVNDSPGFASSRLGVLLGLEAMRMVEEGVASPEDIDIAMELGYRHPMGPIRLGDLVGLDVRLAIAEYLHRKLGDRFEPPRILREKVAAGELGRKSGKGFYTWEEDR